jgi:hypothetical protein
MTWVDEQRKQLELAFEKATKIAGKYNGKILTTSTSYNHAIIKCECENQHIYSIYMNELDNRDDNGFICYECETKCRSCKENKPRRNFQKNTYRCSVYKTCRDCRHNMSINRETNRVANLNTTADSPFPSMDTDVILYTLSLVKHKKGLRFNPFMNYRQVCTRFNECIYGYASHELNNTGATHKETLLYLSKIGVKITNSSDWDRRYKIPQLYVPKEPIRFISPASYFADSEMNNIVQENPHYKKTAISREIYKRWNALVATNGVAKYNKLSDDYSAAHSADRSADHSDAFKLALNLYGSYDNILTHSAIELTKRIMNHYILNDTPCMFDR